MVEYESKSVQVNLSKDMYYTSLTDLWFRGFHTKYDIISYDLTGGTLNLAII